MRSIAWLALGAVLLAAGSLAWYLSRGSTDEPEIPVLGLDRGARSADEGLKVREDGSPKGGVYSGIVVDDAGRPVAGATVLLVRYETGEGLTIPQFRSDGSDLDVRLLPRIGAYEVAAETRSDAQGVFRVAAGRATDRVKLVVAWTQEHAPGYFFTGRPEQEVRVVLQRGGHLAGKVVDPAGNPVSGAMVQIFLQNIAPKGQMPAPGQPGIAADPGRRPVAAAAILGDFLGRVIGPRIYGTEPGSSESLTRVSRSDGTFHLGPVDDSVQLEVVITHPDYMWTDFDEDEQGFSVRPVLKAGERLERTYTLREGNWIEGRVVSDTSSSQGVEGVLIRLRHVVSYKKHPWYDFKTRTTVTRADGSFRMAGLSHGPYAADLFHASFGSEFVGEIPANTKNLVWVVKSRGALEGTIAGLTERPAGGRIEVLLDPVGAQGASGGAQRQRVMVSERGVFLLERLEPGDYRVSVRAGNLACRPVTVRVEAHKIVQAAFDAAGGATLEARVSGRGGIPVDPATVTLVADPLEGGPGQAFGTFVTREGRVEEQGLTPGRYRLEVTAAGYLPGSSEPFELQEGRSTRAPPVVLIKPGTVRVRDVRDARGRKIDGEVTLEVREGEGEWRVLLLRAGEATLRPGPVTLKAHDASGRTWSESFELAEGERRLVEVVLDGG